VRFDSSPSNRWQRALRVVRFESGLDARFPYRGLSRLQSGRHASLPRRGGAGSWRGDRSCGSMRRYDRDRPLLFLVLRVSEAAGGGRVAIGLR
jgi:hypothetical protein